MRGPADTAALGREQSKPRQLPTPILPHLSLRTPQTALPPSDSPVSEGGGGKNEEILRFYVPLRTMML